MTEQETKELAKEAFYIGWQTTASALYSRFVKRVLLIFFVLVILIGFLLAYHQKKFSSSIFEFGSPTELTGVLFNKPVLCIKVISNKDIFGKSSFITIPLVGYGKHGADGILIELEKENGTTFNQKEITLKGTLLYNDGKLLMQIDANDTPVKKIGKIADTSFSSETKELGTIKVRGEVVDPKCFFGVMNPGYGKVHKDCAIRCILGGIPPVLKVQNEKGEMNYYLIAGPNGEKMNEAVKEFVAEPVEIVANAVQYGDWIILYTTKEKINAISKRELVYPSLQAIACIPNYTK